MNRLAKLFLNKSERRAIEGLKQMTRTIPMEYLLATMQGITSSAPIWIGENQEDYIKEAFNVNHIVYSVIMRQADMFSQAKPVLTDHTSGEKEIIEDHQILDVLKKPNKLMNGRQYSKLLYAFKRITGNQYELGFSPDAGQNEGLIQQLYILPAQYVDIVSGGINEPIKGYSVRYNPGALFEAEDVLHLKYLNPDYDTTGTHLYGVSPLKPGTRVTTVSNDQYTSEAKLLQNVGAIGQFTPKEVYENYTLDVAGKFKERFEDVVGPANRGKTFWPNIPLEWQQVAMTAVDLALNDSKKLTKREICDVLTYPSDLLNDPERNKFDSIKEAKKSAWQPVISDLDEQYLGYNEWLVKPYAERENRKLVLEYSLKHVPELQADRKEQAEWLSMAWWIPPNRKLEIMEEAKIDDPMFDLPMVPMNLFNIGDLSTDTSEFEKRLKEWQTKEL